jgi:hypothetical protein
MKAIVCTAGALLLLLGQTSAACAQNKEKIDQLIADVRKGDANAAHALGQMGPQAKDAIGALIAALDTKPAPGVSLPDNAALALAKIGAEAVPALAEVLKEDKPRSWPHAATALKQLGPAAKDAVPALTDIVKKTNEPLTLCLAIDALGAIGPDAASAVPELVKMFTSSRAAAKQSWTHTVVALGKIGPGAADAVPALQKFREGATPTLRLHIDEAVVLIQNKK